MTTKTQHETCVVHVLPRHDGRWTVRTDDDTATDTQHPTADAAELHAHRRAALVGTDVVLVHDRYQRVHRSL
jgi:hypothetical protein